MSDASNNYPPARTDEEREQQMIALATDEAERRIRNGTATSQLLVHYLKLGTEKNKLEQEKLRAETELIVNKSEAAKSAQQSKELYAEAISAFRKYSGQEVSSDEEDIFGDD